VGGSWKGLFGEVSMGGISNRTVELAREGTDVAEDGNGEESQYLVLNLAGDEDEMISKHKTCHGWLCG
jgi:hypothetical protein